MQEILSTRPDGVLSVELNDSELRMVVTDCRYNQMIAHFRVSITEAAALIPILQRFVETGTIEETKEEA